MEKCSGPHREKEVSGWKETATRSGHSNTSLHSPPPHPPYDGAEGPHFHTNPWGVTVFLNTFSHLTPEGTL